MRDTDRDQGARRIQDTSAEAAKARLCAAARAGDALAVEMAGRAYAGAVNRALLIRFARIVRDLLRPDRPETSRRRARPVRLVDFEP
jgi:hypothetical protein